jgi:DNA replication protein DnaC
MPGQTDGSIRQDSSASLPSIDYATANTKSSVTLRSATATPASVSEFMEPARCEFIDRRENVIALGPSGTGKTHVALGRGLAACQKGRKVGFTTAAALVHELMEAVNDRRLQRLQKTFATHDLLIVDEPGFVPLSKTGAELLLEVISQRYERGSIIITSNLPFDEWTEVFGSERPDRRHPRPPDAPRPHPRDERPEL